MKRTHNFSDSPDDSLDPETGSRAERSPKTKRRHARPQGDDFFAIEDEFLESDMGELRPRAVKRRHFREQD